MSEDNQNDVQYDVEKILKKRVRNGEVKIFIKFLVSSLQFIH